MLNEAQIKLFAELVAAGMKAVEEKGWINSVEDAEKWILRCGALARIQMEEEGLL